MAHTPGPWVIDRSIRTAINAGEKHVAMVNFYKGPSMETSVSGNEHEANVNLIAAAPDLLAALKVAQLWLDVDGRYDMQGVNAAIAKAEGRT